MFSVKHILRSLVLLSSSHAGDRPYFPDPVSDKFWVIASGRLQKWREVAFLLIPALIYLAASMLGGMNIGIRHILPVYIFLAILIGGAMSVLVKSRRWLFAVVLLLLFQAISVTRTFPAYMGYANEAFGGPRNVWRYLSDSSADWAQQLHAVKRYTDEQTSCWFVYWHWCDRLRLLRNPLQLFHYRSICWHTLMLRLRSMARYSLALSISPDSNLVRLR
jgi:hypothetical protein